MKNTIARGSEAELMVALIATQQGFSVSTPITHNSEYDLIIDSGEKLNRVQIKRAYKVNNHGYKTMVVETRRIVTRHSRGGGVIAKTYKKTGYDFLIAVDCNNKGFWIIPRSETMRYKAQVYLGEEKKKFFEQWNLLGGEANQ